jgi:hypothetical protein
LASIDVCVQQSARDLHRTKRSEKWPDMKTPARLAVVQRSLAINAVVAEKVLGKLRDASTLYRGSDEISRRHLRQAEIQCSHCLALVGRSYRLPKGLPVSIELNPPVATVLLPIDSPGATWAPHSALRDPFREWVATAVTGKLTCGE